MKSAPKTSAKPQRLVLLDAHAILHRAYHALPDFSTASGEPTGALYGLSAMLIGIIENLKPDYLIACYDVKGPTYRHEAYKQYKAQRKAADDDLIVQMTTSRGVFEALNIPIYDKQGFEADDILGTIVEQVRGTEDGVRSTKKGAKKQHINSSVLRTPYSNLEIIIASGDMDTLQLVDGGKVKVYTLKKGIKDTIIYDEDAVKARFGFGPELIPDYKGLRGDPSDNIPGVKGIGEKTATILITTFGTVEHMYEELEAGHEKKFAKAGITPRIVQLLKDNKEEAEFSKMLATIRRDAPIHFVLPEKTFKEAVDVPKVKALWQKLEFRTLAPRLEQSLAGKGAVKASAGSAEKKSIDQAKNAGATSDTKDAGNDLASENGLSSGQGGLFAGAGVGVGNDTKSAQPMHPDFEKTAVALWLVNSNVTNPTLDDVMNFSGAATFEEARDAIMAELDRRNVRKVYEDIELPLIPIIHKMETKGIKVDRKFLGELAKTYRKEADALQKKIWALAGEEFNISSPKQLGEILFDKLGLTAKGMKKTAGGARSTRESELEKLRDLHPVVPLIFDYRELTKLLSTYIDAIPPLLDESDRLHSHLISAGSTTGRMASQDPNLQNIPVKSDLGRAIRKAFIAEKGHVLAAFDYSQMELRIAAFLSGDEKMIEIFQKGEDVHASVASFVFRIPQDQVTAEMRRQAKAINFGIIYGMGVTALQRNIGTDRATAQKFYDDYFRTFSTLAAYLQAVKVETAKRGYTETFFGRRRYFEGINSKIPFIKAAAERMAINAPIQGTEADVIKLAMIRIDEHIRSAGLEDRVFPLLQVHDELIYEIREDCAADVAPQIEKIMESIIPPERIHGVILKAAAHIGATWGELK